MTIVINAISAKMRDITLNRYFFEALNDMDLTI